MKILDLAISLKNLIRRYLLTKNKKLTLRAVLLNILISFLLFSNLDYKCFILFKKFYMECLPYNLRIFYILL